LPPRLKENERDSIDEKEKKFEHKKREKIITTKEYGI